MRRLFIAINIPEDIKDKIARRNDILKNMFPETRFVGREKWYITVVFLGSQGDENIAGIIKAMNDSVSKFKAGEIVLTDISYAPQKGAPRMIWVNASKETSKQLSPFKISLEDELIKNRVRFGLEKRAFNAHITLTRFTAASKKELPVLDDSFRNLNWSFEEAELHLVESHLSRNGSKYEVLQRIEFKKD